MGYGFSALNKNLSTGNNNQSTQNTVISVGRVLSINLDPNNPSEMGWIQFGDVTSGTGQDAGTNPENNVVTAKIAKPLYPNVKQYPLLNELVVLITQPDNGLISTQTSKSVYYVSIINLWNHPHHNAITQQEGTISSTQNKSYNEVFLGSKVKPSDQPTEIKLGNTFKEKENIHPLLPFEGDVIHEGRWGASIRFGSTVNNGLNNWSKSGDNGDPILILRNGQGFQSDEGWIYVVENINTDDSSIYFTSTQQIPLDASSIDYTSYGDNQPSSPKDYSGKQIILNSGRLVFNSTTDHILFSSAKSVNLNAIESINIDTKKCVIQSNKVYLGSVNATEPLLLGNQTVSLLNQLVSNLKAFMDIMSKQVSTAPGQLLGPINIAASQMSLTLNAIQNNLESIKSKDNFTS